MATQNGGTQEQTQTEQETFTAVETEELLLMGGSWNRPDVTINRQTTNNEYYPLKMYFVNGNLTDTNVIELVVGQAGWSAIAGASPAATPAEGAGSEVWTPEELAYLSEYRAQEWDSPVDEDGHQKIPPDWQPPVLGYSIVTGAQEYEDNVATYGEQMTQGTQLYSRQQTVYYISRLVSFGSQGHMMSLSDTYSGGGDLDLEERYYLGAIFGYPSGPDDFDPLAKAKELAEDILISDVENQIINPLIGYGRLKDKS